MHAFIRKIEKFIRHPIVEVSIGVVLIFTGVSEAGDTIFEDISSGNVGAHHGIIVLGTAHAVKAIPSLLGGMVLFSEADKEHE